MAARVVEWGRRITGTTYGVVAGAGVLGLGAVGEIMLRDVAPSLVLVAVMLALGATVPLALARTHVAAAVLAISATTIVTLALGQVRPLVTGSGVLALLVACYLLGRRRSWRSAAVPLLPLAGYALPLPFFLGAGRPLAWLLLALATAAVAAGLATRVRGEAVRRNASSRAIADTLLEHAARGERARIARELHDVVAHHISMIAVQAETARLTTQGMPDEGARHLLAIGDTARAALTEMRRLLGVLREDAGPEPQARTPQPGLDQLNTLLDEARDSTGASTRLIVRGRVGPIDPGIQLTAYRIIQEALTNARRHAPGAAVDVELGYTADALRVRVRDNGPGPREAGWSGTGRSDADRTGGGRSEAGWSVPGWSGAGRSGGGRSGGGRSGSGWSGAGWSVPGWSGAGRSGGGRSGGGRSGGGRSGSGWSGAGWSGSGWSGSGSGGGRSGGGPAGDPEFGARADLPAGRGPGALAPVTGEAGHGLLGMRERAAMVGGTLRVGAGPVGGFVVEAVLPTPAEAG